MKLRLLKFIGTLVLCITFSAHAAENQCSTKSVITDSSETGYFVALIEYYNDHAFILTDKGVKVGKVNATKQFETVIPDIIEDDSPLAMSISNDHLYLLTVKHNVSSSMLSNQFLSVFNISDPLNIKKVSKINISEYGYYYTTAIADENTLVLIGQQLTFIDISSPNIPELLISKSIPEISKRTFTGKPTVKNGILYATLAQEGMYTPGTFDLDLAIIDITNIYNPQVSNIKEEINAFEILFKNELMFTASEGQGWEIYDATDPINPTLIYSSLDEKPEETSIVMDIFIEDNYLYATDMAFGVFKYDIQQPDTPKLLEAIEVETIHSDETPMGPSVFAKSGDTAILGSFRDENPLTVINTNAISLDTNSEYIAENPEALFTPVIGNNQYLITYDTTFGSQSSSIFSINENNELTLLSTLPDLFPIGIKGNYAFMGRAEYVGAMRYEYSLEEYDISNPAVPVLIKSIPTDGAFLAKFTEDKIYFTTPNQASQNISVIDISDLNNINLTDSININFDGFEYTVFKDTLYYLQGENLILTDISNPKSPVEKGSITANFYPSNVIEVDGNIVYVISVNFTDNGSGSKVFVFDTTNTSDIKKIGEYSVPAINFTMTKMINNNLMILDTIGSGLMIFDTSNPYNLDLLTITPEEAPSGFEPFAVSKSNLIIESEAGLKSLDISCLISSKCENYTSSLYVHEANGRAYSEQDSGFWWFPGTTKWYATGTGEELGAYGYTNITLYSSETGQYTTTACDVSDFAPIINLLGDTEIQLNIGDTYIEPGYEAIDDIDGDITDLVVVNSNIDTSVSGEYSVIYQVTDSSGNPSEIVRRTVTVTEITGCIDYTATLQEHEDHYRAISKKTDGWWWYATTTWYAAGSEEDLGTNGDAIVSLHQYKVGVYHLGACPSAPEVSISNTKFNGNTIFVHGYAVGNNDEIDSITLTANGENYPCFVTEYYTCSVDATPLPREVPLIFEVIATSKSGLESEAATKSIIIPNNFNPVINNISFSVNGYIATINGDIIDSDSDSFTMNLRSSLFGPQIPLNYNCSVNNHTFQCSVYFETAGPHSVYIAATDDSGNNSYVSESDLIRIVIIGDGQCIRAFNSEHVEAGRALSFGNTAYILGENGVFDVTFIGKLTDETSLIQSENGYWQKVDNCE